MRTEARKESKRRVLPEAQRRQMILKAALEAFSAHGYDSCDVDSIAEQAGVGKGTIYRYFHSKQELFMAVIEQGYSDLYDGMYATRQQALPFAEGLRKGMKLYVDFLVTHPKLYRVVFHLIPGHRFQAGDRLKLRHERFAQPLMQAIQRAAADGQIKPIDPEFAAFSLIAMSCIIAEKYLYQEGDTRSRDVDTAIDLFLSGVGK